MIYQDRRKKSLSWIAYLILIIVGIAFINYPEWELRYKTGQVTSNPTPAKFDIHERHISFQPHEGKNLTSRLFQEEFHQEAKTSGRSSDELSLSFDGDVEIYGLLFSIDCWKSTRLVEFAAGIDAKPAYQINGDQPMLFHVTFATNNTAGSIDEHIWFPEPFHLESTQKINIGAWIQNISSKSQSVSPEIIVYYKWVKPGESSHPKGKDTL